MLKSFQELEVWQKAHHLVLDIYELTGKFPDRERFGIVSQLRRGAASIPANIAEGFGRRTTKELLQCLAIANGSLEETRYFLILSRDLGYIPIENFDHFNHQCSSIGQMLGALSRTLRERSGLSLRDTSHGPRVTTRRRPGTPQGLAPTRPGAN